MRLLYITFFVFALFSPLTKGEELYREEIRSRLEQLPIDARVYYGSQSFSTITITSGNIEATFKVHDSVDVESKKKLQQILQLLADLPRGEMTNSFHKEVFGGDFSGETYLRFLKKRIGSFYMVQSRDKHFMGHNTGFNNPFSFNEKGEVVESDKANIFFLENYFANFSIEDEDSWITAWSLMIHEARHSDGHQHIICEGAQLNSLSPTQRGAHMTGGECDDSIDGAIGLTLSFSLHYFVNRVLNQKGSDDHNLFVGSYDSIERLIFEKIEVPPAELETIFSDLGAYHSLYYLLAGNRADFDKIPYEHLEDVSSLFWLKGMDILQESTITLKDMTEKAGFLIDQSFFPNPNTRRFFLKGIFLEIIEQDKRDLFEKLVNSGVDMWGGMSIVGELFRNFLKKGDRYLQQWPVEILLARFPPDSEYDRWRNVVESLERNENIELLKLFYERGFRFRSTSLIAAVKKKDRAFIDFLFKEVKKGDKFAFSFWLQTTAIRTGDMEFIRWLDQLIEGGIAQSITSRNLYIFVEHFDEESISFFLENSKEVRVGPEAYLLSFKNARSLEAWNYLWENKENFGFDFTIEEVANVIDLDRNFRHLNYESKAGQIKGTPLNHENVLAFFRSKGFHFDPEQSSPLVPPRFVYYQNPSRLAERGPVIEAIQEGDFELLVSLSREHSLTSDHLAAALGSSLQTNDSHLINTFLLQQEISVDEQVLKELFRTNDLSSLTELLDKDLEFTQELLNWGFAHGRLQNLRYIIPISLQQELVIDQSTLIHLSYNEEAVGIYNYLNFKYNLNATQETFEKLFKRDHSSLGIAKESSLLFYLLEEQEGLKLSEQVWNMLTIHSFRFTRPNNNLRFMAFLLDHYHPDRDDLPSQQLVDLTLALYQAMPASTDFFRSLTIAEAFDREPQSERKLPLIERLIEIGVHPSVEQFEKMIGLKNFSLAGRFVEQGGELSADHRLALEQWQLYCKREDFDLAKCNQVLSTE